MPPFYFWPGRGLERLNAVRMSTAADGLTEANNYLLPWGADANESLPVYAKRSLAEQ